MAQASANISKKRKHVAEGVFKAELDGYLRKVSFLHYKNKVGCVFPMAVVSILSCGIRTK